jgi:uroporphyrinogen decarboxylase
MNSKERVIKTIEFKKPDRYPILHMWLQGSFNYYGKKLEMLYSKYPADIVDVDYNSKMWGELGQTGKFVDEWGIVWNKVNPYYIGQAVGFPLSDLNKLKEYKFPDPKDYNRFDNKGINEVIENNKNKFIRAYCGDLFELMQFLRGPADLLMDFYDESKEEAIYYLIDNITNYILETINIWERFNVDGIWFMDDWGTNDRLFIHPEKWIKFFKPFYKKIIKKIHDCGRYAEFHSDGYIIDIIPELIELGLDVINPQHNVIGNNKVRDVCYGKICIRTDVDCQKILPYGTAEDVKNHVKEIIDKLGHPEGGLILHGEVELDVPFENYEAMYESFYIYGKLFD